MMKLFKYWGSIVIGINVLLMIMLPLHAGVERWNVQYEYTKSDGTKTWICETHSGSSNSAERKMKNTIEGSTDWGAGGSDGKDCACTSSNSCEFTEAARMFFLGNTQCNPSKCAQLIFDKHECGHPMGGVWLQGTLYRGTCTSVAAAEAAAAETAAAAAETAAAAAETAAAEAAQLEYGSLLAIANESANVYAETAQNALRVSENKKDAAIKICKDLGGTHHYKNGCTNLPTSITKQEACDSFSKIRVLGQDAYPQEVKGNVRDDRDSAIDARDAFERFLVYTEIGDPSDLQTIDQKNNNTRKNYDRKTAAVQMVTYKKCQSFLMKARALGATVYYRGGGQNNLIKRVNEASCNP